MNIIEDTNFLTSSQKDFIENTVLGGYFPFYWSDWGVEKNDGLCNLVHNVLIRPEVREKINEVTSPYYKEFFDIFYEFCNKNNILHKEVLRICINLNINVGFEKSLPHTDHNFDYKHLIVYLNQPDNGSTYILSDDKKTIIKEIKPEQFKGVVFDRCWHNTSFPIKGRRVVAVYTFR